MGSPTHEHTFTLVDRDGDEHHYAMAWTPATRGIEIALFLGSGLAAPIARLVGQVATVENLLSALTPAPDAATEAEADEQAEALADRGVGSLDVGSLLGGIDFAAIGTDLESVLSKPRLAALIISVLSETSRDGKSLDVASSHGKSNYDKAFRANYLEAFRAALEVIKANGFLPLPDTSGIAAKVTSALSLGK